MKAELIVDADIVGKKRIFIKKLKKPYFNHPLHFHQFCELVWIQKGHGKIIIGDYVGDFAEGELIMEGAGLPHLWKSDEAFYKKRKGNFWVALYENEVVGTIALVDFSPDEAALRKMFVHRHHRGKENGVGQKLLDELKNWCRKKGISKLFLGTFNSMHAAHRFYEKNGFVEIKKSELPLSFPLAHYDNMFFKCSLR